MILRHSGVVMKFEFPNSDITNLALAACIGQRFYDVTLDSDSIVLVFENGKRFQISDEGQNCCESRYMETDDNLADLVGDVFMGVDITDGPEPDGSDYEEHEVQFFRIHARFGEVVFSTHNVHNGYYGGFYVTLRQLEDVVIPEKPVLDLADLPDDDMDILFIRTNVGEA